MNMSQKAMKWAALGLGMVGGYVIGMYHAKKQEKAA
jgi:uncharacterized membrane-anchored protein YhcB (DUF1043 family)